jgi:hypothetical protein
MSGIVVAENYTSLRSSAVSVHSFCGKGGSVMEYSFTCPSQGCDFSMKVKTESTAWAIDKIAEVVQFHTSYVHPRLNPLTIEEIRAAVLPGRALQEGEAQEVQRGV